MRGFARAEVDCRAGRPVLLTMEVAARRCLRRSARMTSPASRVAPRLIKNTGGLESGTIS